MEETSFSIHWTGSVRYSLAVRSVRYIYTVIISYSSYNRSTVKTVVTVVTEKTVVTVVIVVTANIVVEEDLEDTVQADLESINETEIIIGYLIS